MDRNSPSMIKHGERKLTNCERWRSHLQHAKPIHTCIDTKVYKSLKKRKEWNRITVGDNSTGLGRDFEFLGGEFENGGERGCLGNAKPGKLDKNLVNWGKTSYRFSIEKQIQRNWWNPRRKWKKKKKEKLKMEIRTLWREAWDRRSESLWRRPFHHHLPLFSLYVGALV